MGLSVGPNENVAEGTYFLATAFTYRDVPKQY